MAEFFFNSVEYQNFGWNALTVSAIGVVAFMLPEGWGLWKQNEAVWKYRSGQSLSLRWFAYTGLYFLAGTLYGIHIGSIAVVLSGAVIGTIHAPLVFGLWKFKVADGELTINEKVQVLLFSAMVPAMAFLPWKDLMYLVFSIGTIYSLATQPWELWKTKSPGVVDVRLIIIYFASTAFWLTFAFTTKALALMLVTPCAFAFLGLTWALWVYYRRAEARVVP